MTYRHSATPASNRASRWAGPALLALSLVPGCAWAHGFAGKRFFPATLAVDDPFVTDEAGIVFSQRKIPTDGGTPADTGDLALDLAKSITPRFAFSAGADYLQLRPAGAPAQNGFANSVVGAKYLAYLDEDGETLASVGAMVEIGGSGTPRVGAQSGSTVSPTLYFGKGLGGLPASLKYLRPLAVTAVLAPNVAASSGRVASVSAGLTLQYSINYLQSFVQDFGWGAPLDRMVFVLELPLQACTAGTCGGQTTGTVNPGVIWVGRKFQLGLEAAIPVNGASGSGIGVMAQLHLFVDDIYPESLGRPVFQ